MTCQPSDADRQFRDDFEAGRVGPAEFHHREHLRLAYVYLCETDSAAALDLMRNALQVFLAANGVDPSRYHETLTAAWIQAVRHFMAMCGTANAFEQFIESDARLLDTNIMLTHYSKERLFCDAARRGFVRPDITHIPQY